MGYPRLILGNTATAALILAAFLQIVPWPIAGFLVLVSVTLATLPRRVFSKSDVHAQAQSVQHTHKPVPKQPIEPRQDKHTAQAEKIVAERPPPRSQREKREVRPTRQKQPPEKTSPPKTPAPKGLKIDDSERGVPRKIPVDDYLSFNVELDSGDEVSCDVEASGIVNVYVLTDDGLASLDIGGEFWYEAGSEEVRNATVRFTAQEEGKWFVVVENAGDKDVSATVKVRVDKESHEAPLLETENLGLPTEGLKSKL